MALGFRKTPVQISVSVVAGGKDHAPPLTCSSCGSEMSIDQPNVDDPDRLLQTCDECGLWFMVDRDPQTGWLAITQLPEPRMIFRAMARAVEAPLNGSQVPPAAMGA
jgi:hypothetical protein